MKNQTTRMGTILLATALTVFSLCLGLILTDIFLQENDHEQETTKNYHAL